MYNTFAKPSMEAEDKPSRKPRDEPSPFQRHGDSHAKRPYTHLEFLAFVQCNIRQPGFGERIMGVIDMPN